MRVAEAGRDISIAHPWHYVFLVAGASVIIRAVMSTIRTIQINQRVEGFWPKWKQDFLSNSQEQVAIKDYFLPTILGTIELSIYPLLIASASWQAIGGWLAFKTAAGWRWEGNAESYMRFLVGNAIVIFASFLLTHMVSVKM